jgi:hypothetical protein
MRRLNSGKTSHRSVPKFLLSRLLSKRIIFKIYKTIILPMILYGCETQFLTLREEYRMRVSENSVLEIILRLKRDEATGGWRKLHNEELHNLYSLPSIIRMIKSRGMRWAEHVAHKFAAICYSRFFNIFSIIMLIN